MRYIKTSKKNYTVVQKLSMFSNLQGIKMLQELKQYQETKIKIQERFFKIVKNINEYFHENEIEFFIDFPGAYTDYCFDFSIKFDEIDGHFFYSDPYEDLFDESIHLNIPIEIFYNDELILKYFLELNEEEQEEERNNIVKKVRGSLLILEDTVPQIKVTSELIQDIKSLQEIFEGIINSIIKRTENE